MKRQNAFSVFLRLLRPHLRRVVQAAVVLICLTFVNLAMPWGPKMILDRVFPNQDFRLLTLILGGMVLVYLLRNVFFFLGRATSAQMGEVIAFDLRRQLVAHLQRMPVSYYKKNSAGKLLSRIMDDVAGVQQFVAQGLAELCVNTLQFVGILVIVFLVNWQLAAVCVAVFPFHILSYIIFKSRVKKTTEEVKDTISGVASNLIEKLMGIQEVKTAVAGDREQETFIEGLRESISLSLHLNALTVWQKVAADLIVGLGTIGMFAYGGHLVMKGYMSVGEFVCFSGYVRMLYPLSVKLLSASGKIVKTMTSFERVHDILSEQTEDASTEYNVTVDELEGSLEFDNVRFAYENSGEVLRGVSFHVAPGEKVALVGPSGAGKSTLVNLIGRFYEPPAGSILVNGYDITKIDPDVLRSHIGIVREATTIFSGTVEENIKYAKPDATREEVIAAAKLANAHEFIEKLPEGYDTRIGNGGLELSTGQKQMIGIARVVLKNPNILILDNATSSVDPATESLIQEALDRLMEGRTTFAITHKMSIASKADKILVLEDGRIVERGTHAELMERNGVYARMFEASQR